MQSTFLKSAAARGDWPATELPEVAVAGRSNVGKSSLINKLVNRRQLARVSSTPGRTQLLNFFKIDERYVLCDLPGYGYAKVPAKIKAGFRPMIEAYLGERENLRALLLLLDARREPGDWELDLTAFMTQHGRVVVPIITKIDKLTASQRFPARARIAKAVGLPVDRVLVFSAVTGEGVPALSETIQRLVAPPPAVDPAT